MSTENAGSRERAGGSFQVSPQLDYGHTQAFRIGSKKDYDLSDNASSATLVGSYYTAQQVVNAINVQFDKQNTMLLDEFKQFKNRSPKGQTTSMAYRCRACSYDR